MCAHTLLPQVLKRFMKMVHPDLFSAHPELREINEASVQTMNGYVGGTRPLQASAELRVLLFHAALWFAARRFLDDLKSDDRPYPPARRETITFIVRTKEKGQFLRVPIELRSTGTDWYSPPQAVVHAVLCYVVAWQ